jgi:lysophospholipase L1-like esterase
MRSGRVIYALISALAVVVAAELGARWCGLGRPLLYEKTGYGYRVVPGQHLKRFGHRLDYNAYGMRSAEVEPRPGAGVLRVLCIGDSITFGSTSTDQSLTYPYQLQALLEHDGGGRYEVLNVSAGGWAMENEEGWLAAHGTYGSQAVVLQVATHDLFQEKAASDIVGTHASFPSRPPLFALQELTVRYVLPRLSQRLRLRDPGEVLYHHDENDVARTMATLERIARLVRARGAELFVLFVEQPRGYEPDDELTRYGKRRLHEKVRELGVPLILTAEAMDAAGGTRAFLDGLHPNALGNAVMARAAAARLAAWQRERAARSIERSAATAPL